jgi:citrate synthase
MQIGKAGPAGQQVSARTYPDRSRCAGLDHLRRPVRQGELHGVLPPPAHRREPTEDQRFFLDLLLVAIAEHGMMPTNVAARMTLAADPARSRARSRPGSSAAAR